MEINPIFRFEKGYFTFLLERTLKIRGKIAKCS